MNIFLERAKELKSKMQEDRHYIHQHAEAGEYLPNTTKYVMGRLKEIGLTPMEICLSGVTAVIEGAKPGRTFLLRADMDALPMPENNDLPFKTETNAAHNCGHDLHTAMLLGAAQILYEHRDELRGCVKLMFQPAEEVFKENLGSALISHSGRINYYAKEKEFIIMKKGIFFKILLMYRKLYIIIKVQEIVQKGDKKC